MTLLTDHLRLGPVLFEGRTYSPEWVTQQIDAVASFLDARDEYRTFLAKLEDLMGFLLPLYVREGRSYLRIGVGCTGGKHRSVAVVEHLSRVLSGQGTRLKVHHRDMERS